MHVTLNENCGEMADMKGEIVGFVPPYFIAIKLPWLADRLMLTPGHVREEAEVVKVYSIGPGGVTAEWDGS